MPQSDIVSSTRRFILVIDDNASDRTLYCEWLEDKLGPDALIVGVDCLKEAKATLETCRPDCIVLDHHLLDGTGLDYLKHLAEYYGSMPPIVLFISGVAEDDLGARALSGGAVVFIPKNKLNPSLLALAVRRIFQEAEAARA